MPTAPKDIAVRTGLALGLVTVAILAAFVGIAALNYVVRVPGLKQFVDIGGEANLPTWWNASLPFLVSVGAVAARAAESDRRRRRAWSLVALAGVLLSLDETASLHERLAAPVRSAGIDVATYAWLVPGVLVALTGSVVLIMVGRALARPTRRLPLWPCCCTAPARSGWKRSTAGSAATTWTCSLRREPRWRERWR